jgi:CDP-4-dehydro-6-deoxyglucose reductase, E3
MTAHVRLLPSGHGFVVEGNDTLLDAALRAGLAPDYGCNNGTCGLCKARVVSGQVAQVRYHDYPLGEVERASGYMLMCSNTALTDAAIEAPEAWGTEDIPLQRITARVRKTEYPTPDVCVLHLQTPRTERLRFLAGQYATLRFRDMPPEDWSIASCPCDGRNLQFHLPRASGSRLSDYVFGTVHGSDAFAVEGPKGRFVLQEGSPRPVIFLAWGTGFAPIKSLIEQAVAVELRAAMYLYRIDEHEPYLHNLCRSWVDALDDFRYAALALSPEGTAGSHERESALRTGMELLSRRFMQVHPRLSAFDVYASGPEDTLAAAETFLLERGVPRDRLFLERSPKN